MANPGLLLKGAKMLSKTPSGKIVKKKVSEAAIKRSKKIEKFLSNHFKKADRKDVVGNMNKYKQGGKGPGASIRTTKPAEVTKSYGQAQRSTDNMFRNDPLTRNVKKLMK